MIHKAARRKAPAGLKKLEKLLATKLHDAHLLDVMADVQHWLNWCKSFGPLSGFETKLEDATLRQMLTVFAYGTQMGPAQMARSFTGMNSRHLSWIYHEHLSEEKLDAAITRVTNGYARFDLPRRWEAASALLRMEPSGRFTPTTCWHNIISDMKGTENRILSCIRYIYRIIQSIYTMRRTLSRKYGHALVVSFWVIWFWGMMKNRNKFGNRNSLGLPGIELLKAWFKRM